MPKKLKGKKSSERRFDWIKNWLYGKEGDKPSWWARFVRIAGPLTLLVLLAGLGLGRLDRYVEKLPAIRASRVVVSLYSTPDWMSQGLAEEILHNAAEPIHEGLVNAHRNGEDQRLPELFAKQLARSGWVNKVLWVRRCSGNQLVVNCEFRRPIALAAVGRWRYLVDANGHLLPGKYLAADLAQSGLIEIRGCSGAPPTPGKQWVNPDFQNALKIIKLVGAMSFRDQIKAVDVSNYGGRLAGNASWILLITDRATVIRWGLPPGQERGLENTTRQKLFHLSRIYRRHGHIDYGRAWVDIRWWPTKVDVSIASADNISPE